MGAGLHWEGVVQWSRKLIQFATVQVVVQLLTAISGLIVVRSLSKPEYALFAIANSMLTSCNLLSDLGITIGLRSIGGRVWNDRVRLGGLVRAVLTIRKKFAFGSVVVCLPLTFGLLYQNQNSFIGALSLSLAFLVAVIPLFGSGTWLPIVQLHGEFKRVQQLDLTTNLLRLALLATLALTKMNTLLTVLAGALGNWFQCRVSRRWATEKYDTAAEASMEDDRELRKLARQWMPNVVFFCVQGQITLLIFTWAHNPVGIADFTALGRIAVLFTLISTTFSNVLVPRFGRCQDPSRLPNLYAVLIIGTFLILSAFTVLAWLWPEPLLWLLGEKYSSLKSECVLVVAAASLSQLGSMMFALNSSRGWIHYQSLAFIPAILGAQFLGASILNLREFRSVLIFAILSAAAPLPIYVLDALHAMRSAARAPSARNLPGT